jgi:quercetin dioxygenase-like cupin family protein
VEPEVKSLSEVKGLFVANHEGKHEIKKIFEARDFAVFYSRLKENTDLPMEVHQFTEIVYRIKGTTRLYMNDREYIIHPNSYAIIPENVQHQTRAVEGSEPVEQIIIAIYDVLEGAFFNSFR